MTSYQSVQSVHTIPNALSFTILSSLSPIAIANLPLYNSGLATVGDWNPPENQSFHFPGGLSPIDPPPYEYASGQFT